MPMFSGFFLFAIPGRQAFCTQDTRNADVKYKKYYYNCNVQRSTWQTRYMKKNTYKREEQGSMLQLLQQSKQLTDYIDRNYTYNVARMQILKKILQKIENGRNQQLKDDIYLYGSMIRQQDLMERQIFLWLHALAEEEKPEGVW